MENLLEEARKIINDVDAQMADLFVKRMRAAEMIYENKKKVGLPESARQSCGPIMGRLKGITPMRHFWMPLVTLVQM